MKLFQEWKEIMNQYAKIILIDGENKLFHQYDMQGQMVQQDK